MKKYLVAIMVTMFMVIGILCITNPGFKEPYKLFENKEGKLIHNYLIFSIYEHLETIEHTEKGNFRSYKRYIGIALTFYEINTVTVKDE